MAIIVKTVGGLGNQLFQYALGKAVSSRLNTELLLDIDTSVIWQGVRVHEFSLGNFNIPVRKARGTDMFGFVALRRHKKFFNFLYRHLRLKRKLLPFYYPERTFAYDPDVFLQKNNTYFDGFWQTEKYFHGIESELRKQITLAKPFSEYSQTISNEIKKTNAVSLHVRRTDYVTDPKSSVFHGICSMQYYQKAIEYIAQRVDSPHFFIFSDDYEWSVENFKFLQFPYTCISNGADKNYEDMTLMSQCQYHIIANSSFSWWGAWLDPRKDKIVIAPKQWFANAPKNDTKDLLPDTWIKL
ncbi:MAG: alpha-1,2-fucosyltransferase [Candidatus Sungbacteria bacterium]|nr:alpha-1,2-fucosyltransferase [Candidatus Sungbacteria bacterium]